MKRLVRKFIPNSLVNYGKHLPMAMAANLKHGFPSKKMTVIGVTGTDGKTTTTNMIYQILKADGKKVSMVSTINAVIGNQKMETGFHVTNPTSWELQKYIKQAKNAGSEYLVLEVTSQGLSQFRNWGIKFEIAVVTNITRDHFDYHKNLQNYRNAKARLIEHAKFAVLNRDDKQFDFLKKKTFGKVVSVSLRDKANLNLKQFPLKLKIIGDYNLLNALQSVAVGQLLKIDNQTIRQTLESFENLPGRMQKVANKRGLNIFIDYAHTANGIHQALLALKKQKKGQIIAVIGAEGERDAGKRAPMGEIAAKLADIVIITAVDPRGKLDTICAQILQGAEISGGKLNKNVFIEHDRQKAIELALQMAKRGDTVGIFGKGHELSMNLDGKKEVAWSDQEAVQKTLNNK